MRLAHLFLSSPLLLQLPHRTIFHACPQPPRAALQMSGGDAVEAPSVAACLEAAFVPAVMGVARGDVTELKLFIAAAQAGYSTREDVAELTSAMDALPVQTAGRPLAAEESAVREQWVGLVYLVLERLQAEDESDADGAHALVPSSLRTDYAAMVAELVRAKREGVALSALDVDAVAPADATRGEAEAALLRQAMRVVYLTLDNVEASEQAGTRADINSVKNPGAAAPPKPFIPGTG